MLISWLASRILANYAVLIASGPVRTLLQNPSIWGTTWALKSADKSFLKGSKVIHDSRLIIQNSIMELKTIFRWQTWTDFSYNRQIKQTLCKTRVQKVLERQSFSAFTVSGKHVCPLIQGFGEGAQGSKVNRKRVLRICSRRTCPKTSEYLAALSHTPRCAEILRSGRKNGHLREKRCKKKVKMCSRNKNTHQKCVLNQRDFYSVS